ncbi:hypothetical protein D3C85_1436800 [compost metagenome]
MFAIEVVPTKNVAPVACFDESVIVIFAEPSKGTLLIVLAVVNFVADNTFLAASAVLSTAERPTSALVNVITPVLPETLSTAPLVIYT